MLVAFSGVLIAVGSAPGEASLVSTDGITTLATTGTVTPGPYTSGQTIEITGTANSVLNNTNLVANSVPGQATGNPTGAFYFEECTDPGGLVANLPTTSSGCEAATVDFTSVQKSADGSFDVPSYTVYDLPDPGTLGSATMVGSCDVAPNTCVVGIFAESPGTTGFNYPHLFSAPFNVDVGDGLDLGDSPGDGTAPASAPTSATNSTVAASSTAVTADGVNTSQVTVSLLDTNGHPVTTPKSVTLSQGPGQSTIDVNGTAGSTATTDSGGHAVFTVSDTNAESVTYTATDTTDSALVLSPTAMVTFAQPVATPTNSSMIAASSAVPSGGSTTVSVTLKDQGAAPQPIAGKVITLGQGGGSSTIQPASTGSDTTNAQGQATFTVSDSTDESITYTATDTTDNDLALTGLSANVTFGNLSVSASDSTVMTTTPTVATTGSGVSETSGTVDVTLLAGSSPVSGKMVTLTGSPSTSVVITPSSQMTGSDGVATFSVSDPTVEKVTFAAVDTSDNDLALTKSTQVSFEVPKASPSVSGITATPSAVPADGVTAAGITVTIEDQFGNPLANKTVTVSGVVTGTPNPSVTANVTQNQSSQSTQITTTNGSGVITFDSNDTTAESITYTAVDATDNVTVSSTATVVFLATATQVSQSSVQAAPTSVPADGKTASTVTVSLEDHNKNPVPGIMVALTALNGSSVISPASGVATDTAGTATFQVTDTVSEVVRYRATDTTDGPASRWGGSASHFRNAPAYRAGNPRF